MPTSPLLQPHRGAHLQVPNRVAMAPLTRNRADRETGVPTELMAQYYRQRASAGLIISEGIWPNPIGKGEPGTPGLVTAEQVEGWRRVTDAVHVAGGRIFAQLWHVGRMSHPVTVPGGALPVAPSAIPAPGTVHTAVGKLPHVSPRPLGIAEIQQTVVDHARAARAALDAGFDGVELNAANGYLLHQFIADSSNRRTDAYGGSIRRRLRFPIEAVDAMVAAIGADRVAVRISPAANGFDVVESDPLRTYREFVAAIRRHQLAYLHVIEYDRYNALADLRSRFAGTVVANFEGPLPSGKSRGEQAIRDGEADIVAFGRSFITNPDLPARFAVNAPLTPFTESGVYTYGPEGYIDWPLLEGNR